MNKQIPRIISFVLMLTMLLSLVSVSVAAEESVVESSIFNEINTLEETENVTFFNDNNTNLEGDEYIISDNITIDAAVEYGRIPKGEESDILVNNVVTTATSTIASGVYKIKNAYNGMYLNVAGTGAAAGLAIQQCTGTSTDNNLNQLFKITYLGVYGSPALEYYSIRPMTNSRLGLETSLSGTTRYATVETISTNDAWSSLLYNHLWSISANGSAYTIKNGSASTSSYLTSPTNYTQGASIYTTTSIGSSSKWIFEAYNGEELDHIEWTSKATTHIVGSSFDYDAHMYSSRIGVNGPVTFEVVDVDGAPTNKAEINASTGVFIANRTGQVKVRATYSGAPWIWYWVVNIEDSYEGTYSFCNVEYVQNMQIDNNSSSSLEGAVFELWNNDGNLHQKFEVLYIADGYYKIICKASNKALTAPSAINDNIVQNSYSGVNTQQWKITKIAEDMYKLSPKSNESYYMAAGDGAFTSNGRNIELRAGRSDNKDEWFFINEKDIRCVGIQDPSHSLCDHTSTFDNIRGNLYRRGFSSFEEYETINSEYLRALMTSSKVVVVNSHGEQTRLLLNDTSLTMSMVEELPADAFAQLELVLLVACETGKGGTGASNLVNAIYNKGAQTVIGFRLIIDCLESDMWVEAFFESLGNGNTINVAIADAHQFVSLNWPYVLKTTESCYFAGNTNQTITNN